MNTVLQIMHDPELQHVAQTFKDANLSNFKVEETHNQQAEQHDPIKRVTRARQVAKSDESWAQTVTSKADPSPQRGS
jgi:hypothetical protein